MRAQYDDAPPADYQLYGLAAPWADTRWLEFVEGEVGGRAWTIWLGHGNQRGPARVIVGSASRGRFDSLHAGLPGEPPSHVAFAVGLHMIGYTLPDASVPRPEGLVRAIGEEVRRQALSCSNWPAVSWTVGGTEVSAHVWRFAGFWAAFTGDLRESYVMAIGTGADPDGLHLEQVLDGTPFGFDLNARLVYGATQGTRLPVTRPDTEQFHRDQLSLLGTG